MGKKIAIIISVVIASVLGFVGAVFGVMALMGKFNEKIVNPTRLEFDANCKIEYDPSNENELHEFVLHGYNDSEEFKDYEVNQKLCYLSVTDPARLITLCDVNGNALTKNGNGRYEVNCNETIYYRVNKDADVLSTEASKSTFGSVSFTARDSSGLYDTKKPFTVWIDRVVKGVYIDVDETPEESNKQVLQVAVGDKVYFNYRSSMVKGEANYALEPIKTTTGKILDDVTVGKKVVEAYHLVKDSEGVGALETWKKLEDCTEQEYIGHDENGYYFCATKTGQYKGFTIAVFDTYDARTNYEESPSAQQDSIQERISKMVNTEVEFVVVSSDVTDVKFNNNGVGLNLYADNMQISLNSDTAQQGKINRNLKLEIKEGNQDSRRYNEIEFNDNLDNALKGVEQIVFTVGDDSSKTLTYEKNSDIIVLSDDKTYATFEKGGKLYTINFGKFEGKDVTLPGNRKLVKNISIEYEEDKDDDGYPEPYTDYYNSTVGQVVLTMSSAKNSMDVLKTGSYFSFYYYNDNADTLTYRPATEFEYSVSQIAGTTDKAKSWNIIAKSVSNAKEHETLKLGLFIVNLEDAEFAYKFACSDVSVDAVELNEFGYVNDESGTHEYILPVTYNLDKSGDDKAEYGELAFEEIIDIYAHTNPSYTSCVFVTEQSNVCVETLADYTFTIGDATYVLVGYKDANGHFVNKVKVKKGADKQTTLYVLQLKNAYGKTTTQTIDGLSDKDMSKIVAKEFITRPIKVTPQYELLNNLTFNYTAVDPNYVIKEESGIKIYNANNKADFGYSISVKSNVKGMLDNIYNMLGGNLSNFAYFASYNATGKTGKENIKIYVDLDNSSYDAETETLTLAFITNGVSSDGQYFRLCLDYNNTIIESDKITILSTDATDIRYKKSNTDLDNAVELIKKIEDIETSDIKLEIEISISKDKQSYDYNWKIDKFDLSGEDLNSLKAIFNKECKESTTKGFVGLPMLVTGHKLTYSTKDGSSDVFSFVYDDGSIDGEVTGINISGVGETYIVVSSAVSRYIKVVVTAKENFSFDVNNWDPSTPASSVTSNEFISYKYDETELSHTAFVGIKASDIKITQYGESGVTNVKSVENGFDICFGSEENVILTIRKDGANWKFARTEYKPNVPLEIEVKFSVLTSNEKAKATLKFGSLISVEHGINWSDTTVYAGTKINLFGEVQTKGAAYEGNPLFRILNLQGGNNVAVYIDDGQVTTSEYQFDNAGTYTITFKHNGEELKTPFEVTVVPNIILQQKDEGVELESASSFGYGDLFVLRSYKTDEVVYGKNDATYSADYYSAEPITDYENITIRTTQEDSLIDVENKATKWIENLQSAGHEETIDVYFNNSLCLGSVDVTTKNKYKVENVEIDDEVKSILAMQETDSFVTYNDETYKKLKSIETDVAGLKFVVTVDGKFKVESADGKNINSEYVPSCFTFTFFNGTDNSKVLVYNYTPAQAIAIKPYLPPFEENEAITNKDFDLINDVLDISGQEFASNVKSLVITDASNKDAFTDDFSSIKGHGYTQSTKDGKVVARFTEFVGDSTQIRIDYKITYMDGVEYSFSKTLVVLNEQDLTFVYPFNDLTTNLQGVSNSLVFKTVQEKESFFNLYGNKLGEIVYEPVLAGSTITFGYDSDMFLTRAKITDRDGQVVDDALRDVEAVAYWDISSFGRSYFRNIEKVNDNSIKFKADGITGGAYTYIIIKVTTTLGNFDYYFVYLYKDSNSSVSSNNQFVINKNYTGVVLNETKFINTELNDITETIPPISSDNIDNVKFYLLSATKLDGTKYEFADGNILNTEVRKLSLVAENGFYNLIIAVVYQEGNAIFNAGRIVAYIMPVNESMKKLIQSEEESEKVTYYQENVENGHYAKKLTNEYFDDPTNENGYLPPFAGTILDAEFVGETPDYVSIKKVKVDDIDKYFIVRTKYVLDENQYFVVKYDFGEDLYVYVHYEYECLAIDTDAVTLETGRFKDETDGFVNTIDLKDMKLVKEGSPEYKGKITITFEDGTQYTLNLSSTTSETEPIYDKVQYSNANGVPHLEFVQTNKAYSISFTLTFDDIKNDGEETSIITKHVTVNVLSSLHKPNASYAISTTVEPNSYTSEKGSKLTIATKSIENEYTKFTIGTDNKYEIYAGYNSTLWFDIKGNEAYACGLTGKGPYKISGNSISFVHLPSEKTIKITFYVQDENEAFYVVGVVTPQNDGFECNLTLAKTYGGLEVEYVADGANHEIVAKGSQSDKEVFNFFFDALESEEIKDISNNVIINSARIVLLDCEGNVATGYNLEEMGFKKSANPNCLSYKGNNGLIVGTDNYLYFPAVAVDTSAIMDITNVAGVEASYEFWITTKAEESEKANGYEALQETSGENYTTILIKDDKQVSAFNSGSTDIAKLFDDKNQEFYIQSLSLQLNGADTGLENGNVVRTDNEEAVIYTVTYEEGYVVEVKFDKATKKISTSIKRDAGKDCFAVAKITFKAYTDSGLLFNNYEVLYYNFTLSSKYDSATKYRVFATNSLDIMTAQDVTISANCSATYASGLTATPIEANYKYGGKSGSCSNLIDNDFYNINGWRITPYRVVKDAEIELTFRVSDKDYYIGNLKYFFHIKCDIEIYINGTLVTNVGQYASTYKMQVDEDVALIDDDLTLDKEEVASGVYTSNILEAMLISYDEHGNKTGSQIMSLDTLISSGRLSIVVNSDEFDDYVKIDGATIKFLNDFTTDRLPLKITYKTTNNGDYVVYWDIKVEGALTFKYVPAGGENGIVNYSSQLLTTGDEVSIIAPKGTHQSEGIELSKNNSNIPNNSKILYSLKYVVANNVEIEDYNARTTFENGVQQDITSDSSLMLTDKRLVTELPIVPMDGNAYIVVYQIQVKYLTKAGDFDATYYVSYLVKNNASIKVNSSSAGANVVTVEDLSNNKLQLFGYGVGFTPKTDNVLFVCEGFTTKAEYDNLKNNCYVRLSNMEGCAISNCSALYYKIEETSANSGIYCINLTQRYESPTSTTPTTVTKLFNNELVADLYIVQNEVPIVGIDKYKSTNTAGFKLKGDDSITAKCDPINIAQLVHEADQYEVSLICSSLPTSSNISSYFKGATSVGTSELVKTYTFCGVEYKLYNLVVTGSTSDKIYDLIATNFYALESPITIDDNPAVVVPSCWSTGDAYFVVPNSETSFDLTGKFKCMAFEIGEGTNAFTSSTISVSGIVTPVGEGEDFTLAKYKEDNPNDKYYKETKTITISNNIQYTIWWELPDLAG